MLATTEPREITTSGTLETATFNIKANGKAFKVLIDGLYSDKIKAVVRELWTNAHDSHVEAGNAGAFDCHLPTTLEPYFSVRDYGVSLSHDDVMHLYTTVFASTKENTNSQVGKLGLGSKSPFAYTDTFTLTAWRKGQKRVYSAYIGEDYVPRISLMSEADSDEAQGLEVSFPVKNSDCHAFKEKAEGLLVGFDPRPNVPGAHVTEMAMLFEGAGWKLYNNFADQAHAKQGCVIYPLDAYAVVGATDAQRSLLSAGFMIDFPVGELEITANRESLGYDKPTCANILARLGTIEAELLAQIEGMLKGCSTIWEARAKARALKVSSIPECAHKLMKNLKWRGKSVTVDTAVVSLSPKEATGVHIDTYDNSYWGYRRRNKNQYVRQGVRELHVNPDRVLFVWHDTSSPVTRIEERLRAIYDDVSIGQRNAYQNREYSRIVVIKAKPGANALKRLLVKLGRPEVTVRLNDVVLPKAENDRVTRKVKVKALNGQYGRRATEVDLTLGADDTVYYVQAERNTVVHSYKERSFYSAYAIFKALKASGDIPQDANGYVIPASCKRMIKGAQFVNILDLAQKVIADRFDATKAARMFDLEHALDETGKWGNVLKVIHDDLADFPIAFADTAMGKHIGAATATMTEYAELQRTVEPLTKLASEFNGWTDPNKYNRKTSTLLVLSDYLRDVYPMLHIAIESVSGYNIDHVFVKKLVDYVNLVDSMSAIAVQDVAEIAA